MLLAPKPRERLSYGDLKRRLAAEHTDDREAYTDGKADFVAAVTAAAHAWRAERHPAYVERVAVRGPDPGAGR